MLGVLRSGTAPPFHVTGRAVATRHRLKQKGTHIMLSIPAYPRQRWSLRLSIATILLGVGIVFGYGIPVGFQIHHVSTAEETATNVANANRFWRMVAGVEPLDESDLGQVAATVRELGREPNPIRALLDYYVAPGELPDLDVQLGYHAFDRPDPDRPGKTLSDEGRFTDRFILDAIQALGAAEGTSVRDVQQPVPDVPGYGLLRWEWGAGALGGVLAVSGLCGLWLRRDRRRWPIRAEARAVAALSDDEREVYRIAKSLERQPRSKERDELLMQATSLFRDMNRGLDTRDKLTDFREALSDANTAWQIKREVYNELP